MKFLSYFSPLLQGCFFVSSFLRSFYVTFLHAFCGCRCACACACACHSFYASHHLFSFLLLSVACFLFFCSMTSSFFSAVFPSSVSLFIFCQARTESVVVSKVSVCGELLESK